MPMNNSLNVSELLKRLGVVGDSQGSAALLDQLRLSINIANLDHLVPPVGVPVAAGFNQVTAAVGDANGWSVQCQSAGGMTILGQADQNNPANQYFMWVTDASPWVASTILGHADFTFQQPAVSLFHRKDPGVAVFPDPNVNLMRSEFMSTSPMNGQVWAGPGQFFNVEARQTGVFNNMSIMWKEYPGAINPT